MYKRKDMSKARNASRSDGEATRQRILIVTGEMIAAHGFVKTKSKDIAMKADVDLASINYHFKSRENLYQKVLIEAHRQMIKLDRLQAIEQQDKHPDDKFKDFIEYLLLNNSEANAWAPRILAREILSPSTNLTELINEEVKPKLQVVRKLLSDVSGIPLDSPKLYPCVLSVIAPCLMYLANQPIIKQTLSDNQDSTTNDIIEHFVKFGLSGLKAITYK